MRYKRILRAYVMGLIILRIRNARKLATSCCDASMKYRFKWFECSAPVDQLSLLLSSNYVCTYLAVLGPNHFNVKTPRLANIVARGCDKHTNL